MNTVTTLLVLSCSTFCTRNTWIGVWSAQLVTTKNAFVTFFIICTILVYATFNFFAGQHRISLQSWRTEAESVVGFNSTFSSSSAILFQTRISAHIVSTSLVRWTIFISLAFIGKALFKWISSPARGTKTHWSVSSGLANGSCGAGIVWSLAWVLAVMIITGLTVTAIRIITAFSSKNWCAFYVWITSPSCWTITTGLVIDGFTQCKRGTVIWTQTGVHTFSVGTGMMISTFQIRLASNQQRLINLVASCSSRSLVTLLASASHSSCW